MRFSKKIIPGIVLFGIMLSLAPIGVPTADAATAQETYNSCMSGNGPAGTPQDSDYCLAQARKIDPNFNKTPPPATTNECAVNNPVPCIAAMVYYIGPGLAANVAYIGAYFFSIVVQLSLNSIAYALDFLSSGWTTVRDIANMAFIFILIYIALTVMLFAETSGTIKQLALVIVIALLVNFSFFFTRLTIDTGNILAIQFYNAIPMETVNGKPATINGVKDLSASIMGAVQLQKLYGSSAFDKASQACGKDGNGQWCGLIVSTVVYVAVAAMFWMLFFAFLQVGVKFLLRIVGLWFLLIASPLAFVAKTIPKTAGYFDQWFRKLVEFSIYPAIFLFMFLILTGFTKQLLRADSGGGSILDAAMNSGGAGATGIGAAIAAIGIRMGFVLALMYVALHVSDWVVKEGSAMASKATGWSVGKTLGSAGWLGRASIGSVGGAIASSTTLGTSKNILAQGLWRAGRYASRSSFDARTLPGVRSGAGHLGGVDIGEAGGVGGAYAQKKEVDKKREEARQEREGERRDLQNKRDQKMLPVVEAEIKQMEAAHKEKEAAAGTVARFYGEGGVSKEEADRLNQLKLQKNEITDRVKEYDKRQIESMGAKDIEKIAHIIKESQLKTVKDSTKYTDDEKDAIHDIYHKTNPDAPMQKFDKQVELLRKVHKDLQGLGVDLQTVGKHTDPTTHPVITGKVVEEMQDELKQKIAEQTQILRASGGTVEDKAKAGRNVISLQDLRAEMKALNDARKAVPTKVSRRATPGEVEVTK